MPAGYRRSQNDFRIGKVLRVFGQQVLRIEHLLQRRLAACETLADLLRRGFGAPSFEPSQGQNAKLDVPTIHGVGSQAQTFQIGIYRTVEITRPGSLGGPFEAGLCLRLGLTT
jgi:hypothetical protein